MELCTFSIKFTASPLKFFSVLMTSELHETVDEVRVVLRTDDRYMVISMDHVVWGLSSIVLQSDLLTATLVRLNNRVIKTILWLLENSNERTLSNKTIFC